MDGWLVFTRKTNQDIIIGDNSFLTDRKEAMFSAEALALIQNAAQEARSVEVLPVEDPRICHVRVNGRRDVLVMPLGALQHLRALLAMDRHGAG